MPKKDKDNFIIIGDVKLKVLHIKELERTTLFLYIKLPKGFDVVLKNVSSTPDNKKMVKDGNRDVRRKYQEIREKIRDDIATPGERKEFERIETQSDKNWKKQKYDTIFDFCIIQINDSERTEDKTYHLPGVGHSVSVNINSCIDDNIPDAVLENLKVEYTEKFN